MCIVHKGNIECRLGHRVRVTVILYDYSGPLIFWLASKHNAVRLMYMLSSVSHTESGETDYEIRTILSW